MRPVALILREKHMHLYVMQSFINVQNDRHVDAATNEGLPDPGLGTRQHHSVPDAVEAAPP
eukprot:scaffold80795_cov32-Prasinocladus_malaysianus.AAC.1